MILLQTVRERARVEEKEEGTRRSWRRTVGQQAEGEREKESEGEKVERYIKLSQLYEAGMEMNTPRHTRSLPCLPLYAIP